MFLYSYIRVLQAINLGDIGLMTMIRGLIGLQALKMAGNISADAAKSRRPRWIAALSALYGYISAINTLACLKV